MAAPRPASKTYGASPKKRAILLGLVGGPLLLPALLIVVGCATHNNAATATGALLLAIMTPILMIPLYALRTARLTVTPEGLQVRDLGSTAFVRWEAIERIRLVAGCEGLVLRDPSQEPWAARLRDWSGVQYRGASFYDDEEQQLLAEGRYLPLKPYAYWLIHGELLHDIAQYAPWLAEHVTGQLATHAAGQVQNRRVLLTILGVSGLLGVVAMIAGAVYANLSEQQQAVLDRAFSRVDLALGWLFSLALLVHALVNLRAAWTYLCGQRFGLAALWVLLAIIQVGLVLAIIGALQ